MSVKLQLPCGTLHRVRLAEALPTLSALDAATEAAMRPHASAAQKKPTGTDAEDARSSGYTYTFADDEGERCAIANDAELAEALRLAAPAALRLAVAVAARARSSLAPSTMPTPPSIAASPAPSPMAILSAAPATPATGAAVGTTTPPSSVEFVLNGKGVVVPNADPRMLLIDYLRDVAGLTGTKSSCRQGGCGACTVMMADGGAGAAPGVAINACLRPLCAVDGKVITTTEGIGNARDGYHPVQQALARGNGSQCGFCSPGMVMNMYSLLQRSPHPSAAEVETALDGNICRCTGYRPILEAFKGLSSSSSSSCCTALAAAPPPSPQQPKQFGSEGGGGCTWVEPTTIADLCTTLWGAATAHQSIRIVAGNTGHGVFPDDDVTMMVNVGKIATMHASSVDANGGLVFGGAVPIQSVIDALEARPAAAAGPGPDGRGADDYWKVLAQHMRKIASYQVRNVGSWAGNLALCHKHRTFQSDLATILSGAGAQLTFCSDGSRRTLSVAGFYALESVEGGCLTSLRLPGPRQTANPPNTEFPMLRTYKSMKRHQNAHAAVNAAIYCTLGLDRSGGRGGGCALRVSTPVLVFGGVQPGPCRASRTETFLAGKDLADPATITGALAVLRQELPPTTDAALRYTEPPAYRADCMCGFLFKYYLDACSSMGATVDPAVASGAPAWMERAVSSSTQTYDPGSATCPAVPKIAAARQTAGEAQYAADHPPQAGGLYCAYVLSSRASATISSIPLAAAQQMPGYVDFISAADLGERNVLAPHGPMADGQTHRPQLFAPLISPEGEGGGAVQCSFWGQPLGMIVADTREHAERIAQAVAATVQYTEVTAPCVTIVDAIAQGKVDAPRHHSVGDVASAFAAAGAAHTVQGEIELAAQYHFYMETQTSVARPMEDDGVQVICSTQGPSMVQSAIATALELPLNKVIVSVKRAGGGYGGKITGASTYAVAAAFAAHRHRTECRLIGNIVDNMASTGKRCPWKFEYKVSFTATGQVTAVQGTVYCGNWRPSTNFMRCYSIPNWDVQGINCHLNAPDNTYMRAPTELGECTFMNEIMDHVATALQLPAETVRARNLAAAPDPTQSNLPALFTSLLGAQYADVSARRSQISAFNSANTWRKRGLACVPTEYSTSWGGTPSHGALVDVPSPGHRYIITMAAGP